MSFNLGSSISKPLQIVGVVVAAIVGLALMAAFLPTLFASTSSITENVTDGTTGNAQADGILHVFGFIVPIVIIVAIVGLIFLVVDFKKK